MPAPGANPSASASTARVINRGLAEVRTRQSKFEVVLDPLGVDRTLTERKQVKLEAAIRPRRVSNKWVRKRPAKTAFAGGFAGRFRVQKRVDLWTKEIRVKWKTTNI